MLLCKIIIASFFKRFRPDVISVRRGDHAGQKSDNPEIHRYITVYYQDVKPIDAMFYVLDEILKEDTSKFEGKPVEEVIEYIRERYDEKVEEKKKRSKGGGL